ncbi:hypothetical protein F5B19DRAFT_488426 [Rostrohypoxylon terebratum]|nr:hypothetical protein F5B19DRAFT_488426 [Rostrohypoxylon terebratum]
MVSEPRSTISDIVVQVWPTNRFSIALSDGARAESTSEQRQFLDWQAMIDPNVKGSWNLHAGCPKGLDFFVRLFGECAVSINLGDIADAGYIAECKRHSTIFQQQDKLEQLQLPEIFTLLDICCNPGIPLTSEYHRQQAAGTLAS